MLKFHLDLADTALHSDYIGLCGADFFVDCITALHLLMLGEIAKCLTFCQDDVAVIPGLIRLQSF